MNQPPTCPSCGYDLTGADGFCPECGEHCTPQDLARRRSLGQRRAWLLAWELRLGAAGGAVASASCAAAVLMAGMVDASLVIFFILTTALAASGFWLAHRMSVGQEQTEGPHWAETLAGQAVGVVFVLLGAAAVILACLLLLAFFAFFVMGANP